MVVSRLNKKITYQEVKRLEKDDTSKKAILYELELENPYIPKTNIVIAIGNVKRKYENIKNGVGIVYFPIYFITKNKTAIQIGVYEIFKDELYKFIDNDIDNNIKNYDLFEQPLLWSWIDNTFIVENRLSPIVLEKSDSETEKEGDDDEDDNEEGNYEENIVGGRGKIHKQVEYIIPEHRKDTFTLMRDVRPPEMLKEETPITAKYFKKENDLNWISKFMKNENYDISDKNNLFHSIQSAFEQIGQQTYEKKLCKKLSESKYIESYFHNQKLKYNEYIKYYREIQKKLETVTNEKNEYKKRLKHKKDTSVKLQEHEIKEYNELKNKLDTLTTQKMELKKMMREYDSIKSIDNVEQMKDYILSKQYRVDEETLYALERILKIKFIVFREESHRENDMKGIIDCGLRDEKLGKFHPEYYILLEYSEEKNTYNLVSYKNKRIFSFNELPYDLKNIISYKCIENVDGNFRFIPEWVHFHKLVTKRGDLYEESQNDGDIQVEDIMLSGIMRKYDGVKINIYCHSSQNKFPGKIRGETMPFDENMVEYTILSSIKNWRCILDNNWTGTDVDDKGSLKSYQFELNGYYWASVQHYVQACKFREDNPHYYSKFALGTSESDVILNMNGKDLSNSVELAIFIGTKTPGKLFKGTSTGELKGYQRDKKIQIDRLYNEDIEMRNMKDALYAKFSQNPTYKKVLVFTRNSQLFYAPLKKRPYPAEELMIVRDMLIKS